MIGRVEPAGLRRWPVAGGVLLLITAVALAVLLWPSSPVRHPSRAAAAPLPTPTTSAMPAPPSSAPPTRPATPHDVVPPATPTSFVLTGKRFTIRGHVCPMANIRPYDPPGEQHHTICWVRSGFGVAPSSRQPATTYLFGHSWAEDPLEVLNKASALATAELLRARPHLVDGVPVYPLRGLLGYRLVLRTRSGTLTYRVRSAWAVRKTQLGFIRSWLDPRVPDRVLLTTCAELRGVDYPYNVILDAGLVASRRG
jgi:hypothetical protein